MYDLICLVFFNVRLDLSGVRQCTTFGSDIEENQINQKSYIDEHQTNEVVH